MLGIFYAGAATTGTHGSYATPIVADLAGGSQVLVTGMSGVASYSPETGQALWRCDGPAEVTAGTMAYSDTTWSMTKESRPVFARTQENNWGNGGCAAVLVLHPFSRMAFFSCRMSRARHLRLSRIPR